MVISFLILGIAIKLRIKTTKAKATYPETFSRRCIIRENWINFTGTYSKRISWAWIFMKGKPYPSSDTLEKCLLNYEKKKWKKPTKSSPIRSWHENSN